MSVEESGDSSYSSKVTHSESSSKSYEYEAKRTVTTTRKVQKMTKTTKTFATQEFVYTSNDDGVIDYNNPKVIQHEPTQQILYETTQADDDDDNNANPLVYQETIYEPQEMSEFMAKQPQGQPIVTVPITPKDEQSKEGQNFSGPLGEAPKIVQDLNVTEKGDSQPKKDDEEKRVYKFYVKPSSKTANTETAQTNDHEDNEETNQE